MKKKLPEGWVRVSGFPEMTPEQIERLKALEASDAPVDCSDIPELDGEWFKRARRGRPTPVRSEPAE